MYHPYRKFFVITTLYFHQKYSFLIYFAGHNNNAALSLLYLQAQTTMEAADKAVCEKSYYLAHCVPVARQVIVAN